MKKSNQNGVITLESEDYGKFINEAAACMAFESMQRFMAFQGYLTCSTISPKNQKYELTVHFEDSSYPQVPIGYKFTKKTITSHKYWQEWQKKVQRVRCIEFTFKY